MYPAGDAPVDSIGDDGLTYRNGADVDHPPSDCSLWYGGLGRDVELWNPLKSSAY